LGSDNHERAGGCSRHAPADYVCRRPSRSPGSPASRPRGSNRRFTIHGLRRTFVDLARRARVDSVVTRALTGHVTEKMRIHYSSVGMDEKRSAVVAIAALVQAGGDRSGDPPPKDTRADDEPA